MSIITSSSACGSSETTSGLDQLLPERGPQRAIGLDVDIRGLPTARSKRMTPTCGPVPGGSPHSEREQAIEEEAIAYQCLPQILGGGLLTV
jgi:hypothetical protein